MPNPRNAGKFNSGDEANRVRSTQGKFEELTQKATKVNPKTLELQKTVLALWAAQNSASAQQSALGEGAETPAARTSTSSGKGALFKAVLCLSLLDVAFGAVAQGQQITASADGVVNRNLDPQERPNCEYVTYGFVQEIGNFVQQVVPENCKGAKHKDVFNGQGIQLPDNLPAIKHITLQNPRTTEKDLCVGMLTGYPFVKDGSLQRDKDNNKLGVLHPTGEGIKPCVYGVGENKNSVVFAHPDSAIGEMMLKNLAMQEERGDKTQQHIYQKLVEAYTTSAKGKGSRAAG